MTTKEYFDTTVQKVLTQIGCIMKITISIADHDSFVGKAKNALGICNKNNNGYSITIDGFFVEECYRHFETNEVSTWGFVGITLEEVICHELAHIAQWNHCKKHRELTHRLLNKVTLPERRI